MVTPLGATLELGPGLTLKNRFVATAHAPGMVADGIPLRAEARYWGRVARGGPAMVIVGGTAVSPPGTGRRGNICQAWRADALPGQAARAEAISDGGAIPILQLVHLGRETLGAEQFHPPVAPSPVRSPRELTRPLALTESGVAAVVADFSVAALQALDAGFAGIELHAAHGYLLAQFLSPVANPYDDAERRLAPVLAILAAVREQRPDAPVGIRLSVGDEADCGLSIAEIGEVAMRLGEQIAWVNLTVGMRNDYVQDMATAAPPLLEDLARLRSLIGQPLIASQAFRTPAEMESARAAGADLVGVARPLIADPDFPSKILAGRTEAVRPCVSCNEDCRAFDPTLLCSVNPDLAPPGLTERPAAPVHVRTRDRAALRRIAVVGAGPAGLEAATTLAGTRGARVTLWERSATIGGALAVATAAPHRHGWQRLLDFYAAALVAGGVEVRLAEEATSEDLADADAVILGVGADELRPDWDAAGETLLSSEALIAGSAALGRPQHVIVVDDGAGWWPTVSSVELAVAAGAFRVSVVTPGTAFAGAIPLESRGQLAPRLRDLDLHVHALSTPVSGGAGRLELERGAVLEADAVIVVGERRARDWAHLATAATVIAIGDGVVPRKAAHAIAEGRRAARDLAPA